MLDLQSIEHDFIPFNKRVPPYDETLARRPNAWCHLGPICGDAFCLGSHWIYDLAQLARRYPSGLSGFEAPVPGHYHYGKKSGEQTHYGDAGLLLLESVAAIGGVDSVDFGRCFVAVVDSPNDTGYRYPATQDALANYRAFREARPAERFDFQQGADDSQSATATRLAAIVVAHGRDERLLEAVTSATRVRQNNPRAIAYMHCHALMLASLFGRQHRYAAFEEAAKCRGETEEFGSEVSGMIRRAQSACSRSVLETTLAFGQSCALGSSFPAAVQAVLAHPDQFAPAILATVAAGGDNAGRAALVGAWLDAVLGLAGMPADWRARLAASEVIDRHVETLIAKTSLDQDPSCLSE